MEEAARRRLPTVDVAELQSCWQAVYDNLWRGIRPDLRNLLETLQQDPQGFVPADVPDEIFVRLNVDSYSELIAKLEETVRSDWVVNAKEGYMPHPLLGSFKLSS